MGVAEDAFERLRRIAFEGEHVERMAALGVRMKLSPGVIKIPMRLAKGTASPWATWPGASAVTPRTSRPWSTTSTSGGWPTREPAPCDRRVKIIVLTDAGRALATEIDSILSVPPAAFAALSQAELRQLRDLLEKVLAADEAATRRAGATRVKVGVAAP